MCWLTIAKNWRTVGGRCERIAFRSRSTTALSSSSGSKFSGGNVRRRYCRNSRLRHRACSRRTERSSSAADDRLGRLIACQGIQETLYAAVVCSVFMSGTPQPRLPTQIIGKSELGCPPATAKQRRGEGDMKCNEGGIAMNTGDDQIQSCRTRAIEAGHGDRPAAADGMVGVTMKPRDQLRPFPAASPRRIVSRPASNSRSKSARRSPCLAAATCGQSPLIAGTWGAWPSGRLLSCSSSQRQNPRTYRWQVWSAARLRVGAEAGVREGRQDALDGRQRRRRHHAAHERHAEGVGMPAGHVAGGADRPP